MHKQWCARAPAPATAFAGPVGQGSPEGPRLVAVVLHVWAFSKGYTPLDDLLERKLSRLALGYSAFI